MPSPSELWVDAARQHPDDENAQRETYLALMREHGHIVPAVHPDTAESRDLPCGWPRSTR
jgi:hypothetical protein